MAHRALSALCLLLALLGAASAGRPASAENPPACLWKFQHYGVGEGTVTCTCGPPGDVILNLDPLNEELGIEGPRYEGSILQQAGNAVGTWSYAPHSNVCMAAQHAGIIENIDVLGGIVTFAASPGCPRYEGSPQFGIASAASGENADSYYFPARSDGACPGEAGYGNHYRGAPALQVLLGMAETAMPRGGFRHGTAEVQGIEAFSVERIFLRPPERPAIAVGRLTVERVDMENLLRKMPPRYLTLALEEVSLPSVYLGPMMEALFPGERLSGALRLDLRFDRQRGRLELGKLELEIEGHAALRLRAKLSGLGVSAIYGDAQEEIALEWLRLRLDDRDLLALLLAAWLGTGTAPDEAQLQELLYPAIVSLASEADPRTRALLAAVGGLLRDLAAPAGELQAYLQPPAPLTFGEIARLLEEEPGAAATALRAALLYPAPTEDLGAGPPALSLAAAKAVFAAGEPLAFRFLGSPAPDALLALHFVGEPPSSTSKGWVPLAPGDEAGVSLPGLSAGLYEAVLLQGGQAAAFAWFAVE